MPYSTLIAAPGDLDASFGDSGRVIRTLGTYATARATVVDVANRCLVVGEALLGGGQYHFAVERYLDDGSPDLTFGVDGTVTVELGGPGSRGASAVALQTDGKIVVAGQGHNGTDMDFAVMRLLPDGTLDPTFSGDGKVIIPETNYLMDVGIQSDGSIILAGSVDGRFGVVRLTEFGQVDVSFSGDGIVADVPGSTHALAIDGMDRIILGGYVTDNLGERDFAVLRYLPDGTLDTSFSTDGKVITPTGPGRDGINDLAIQGDGKIVVVGRIEDVSVVPNRDDFAVARYTETGELDVTFASGGVFTASLSSQASGTRDSNARAVQIAIDGKIVVGGRAVSESPAWPEFAFLRLDRDGNLDTTFGDGGTLILPIGDRGHFVNDLAIQRDGRIVAVCYWAYLLVGPPNWTRTKFATVRLEGDPDTDHDGLPDYAETNTGVFGSQDDTGTDPNDSDSDGDGLSDGHEVRVIRSNPHLTDSDADGFDDGFEIETGFDPTSDTSTPETYSTIMTAVEFRFNAADGVTYKIESSTDLDVWDVVEGRIVGTGNQMTRFYTIEALPKRYFRATRE